MYATTSLADCNYTVIYVRVLVKCFCSSGYDSASHILFISFSKCLKRVLNISLGGGTCKACRVGLIHLLNPWANHPCLAPSYATLFLSSHVRALGIMPLSCDVPVHCTLLVISLTLSVSHCVLHSHRYI